MQRKTRITATPVEEPQPEGLARAWTTNEQPEEAAKTDAEHMTDVINEVKVIDDTPILTTEYAPPEPKPKAKAKPRASKATAKMEELAVAEVTPTLDEVAAVVELPQEDAKEDAKVDCPDCGKQLTAKTLKYSHACPAKNRRKQQQQQQSQIHRPSQSNSWSGKCSSA